MARRRERAQYLSRARHRAVFGQERGQWNYMESHPVIEARLEAGVIVWHEVEETER